MSIALNSPNHGIKLEQYMLNLANCHLKLDSKHEAANAARYYKKSNIKENFSNLTEEKDSLVWQSDTHGQFSVNSAYRALNKTADQETDWPWKMIWKPKVPYKENCFLWLLSKEAVLTHENLKKRGYQFAL